MAAGSKNEEMAPELYSLQPKFIFGLTAGISNSCLFQNDDVVVYQVAGVLVVHDISNNSQRFLYLNNPLKIIMTMAICHIKNLIAVAEKGYKRPSICVYSLKDLKLVRQLILPLETKADCFIKLEFSYDGVYLAALSDSPDYVMYYYDWNQSKVESHVQAISSKAGVVSEMALNPYKNRLCVFVGKGLFRLMNMGELIWKQYGFHKAGKFNFTTVCWLNEDYVMAGTADGRLFLFEKGELKAVYNNVYELTDFDLNYASPNPLMVGPSTDGSVTDIRHCTNIGDGLMFVVNGNRIYHYKMKTNNQYHRSHVFFIPDETAEREHNENRKSLTIHTLCVSPNNKCLACLADNLQLYLTTIDGKSGLADVVVEPFGAPFHLGGVSSLSICDWTSTFMTGGKTDKTVKLWDYHTRTLLQYKRYWFDVQDVSLHPSGLFALVAFNNYVRLVVLSSADGELITRQKFVTTNCHAAQYSEAGHLFALVDNGAVDVYCAVTFAKLHTLGYHESATITDLVWAGNDWTLYSCDSKGDVYQFNLYTKRHVAHIRRLDEAISGIAVSVESKKIYSASRDGRIREIYGNVVIRDKDLGHGPIDAISLSKSNLMFFAACEHGVVLSLSTPIKSQIKYNAFNVHNKTVSKMKQTSDDSTLITCSLDGSICIWTVKNSQGNVPHEESTLQENTIVRWTYLKEMADTVKAQKSLWAELNKKRAKDKADLKKHFKVQMQKAPEELETDLRWIKKEKKETVASYDDEKSRLENEKKSIAESHDFNMKMLEKHYVKQLQTEDEDYVKLETDMANTNVTFKRDEIMKIEKQENNIRELTDKLNKDLMDIEDDLQNFKGQLHGEHSQFESTNEELHVQLERKTMEAIVHVKDKIENLTVDTEMAKRIVDKIESNINEAKKVKIDVVYAYQKKKEELETLQKSDKMMDEKLIEYENELEEHDKIIKKKDAEIKERASTMDYKELLILVFRFKLEVIENAVEPLKTRLSDLEIGYKDITDAIETAIHLKEAKRETRLKLKKRIKTILKDTRKSSRNLRYGIEVSKNNIDLDLQIIFRDNSDNVVKLKENIRRLHKKITTTDLSANVKSLLPNQRVFLEKCLAHIKNDQMIAEQRPSAQFQTMKDNLFLSTNLNKLKNDLYVNKKNFENLVIEMERKKNPKNPNLSCTLSSSNSSVNETVCRIFSLNTTKTNSITSL